MMKATLATGMILSLLMVGSALAASKKDDDKDKPPPMPDPTMTECTVPFRPAIALAGSVPVDEQLVALHAKVTRYQAQLQVYRACLNPKMSAAQSSGDNARDAELVKKYNDSVDAEKAVAEAYNKLLAANQVAQKQPAAKTAQRTARN